MGKSVNLPDRLVTESWPSASADTPIIVTERLTTIRSAATPQTYVAYYQYVRAANRLLLPYLAGPVTESPPALPALSLLDPPGSRIGALE